MFSCEFYEISENIFFNRLSWWLLLLLLNSDLSRPFTRFEVIVGGGRSMSMKYLNMIKYFSDLSQTPRICQKTAEAFTGDVKKVFLEIPQNSQKNPCSEVSFLIKLQQEALNFLKKTLTLVFSCEFCKFFKNTFYIEHLLTFSSATRDLEGGFPLPNPWC